MHDGRELRAATAAPLGSLENPMSDAALSNKFRRLAEPVIGEDATARLLANAWVVSEQADLGWVAADG